MPDDKSLVIKKHAYNACDYTGDCQYTANCKEAGESQSPAYASDEKSNHANAKRS